MKRSPGGTVAGSDRLQGRFSMLVKLKENHGVVNVTSHVPTGHVGSSSKEVENSV